MFAFYSIIDKKHGLFLEGKLISVTDNYPEPFAEFVQTSEVDFWLLF